MTIDREKLVKAIQDSNVTQAYVARQTGLANNTVNVACKKGRCNFDTIRKIAKCLNVPVIELIGGE